jgi:hypothetical protein
MTMRLLCQSAAGLNYQGPVSRASYDFPAMFQALDMLLRK